MEKESIHVGTEPAKNGARIKGGPVSGGMSIESKLLIANLVLFFIAANVWGYYLYKKGYFGISADIMASPQVSKSVSPAATPQEPENANNIFMLPQAPGV